MLRRKFSLVVWEETEEFKKFFDEAEQKRKKLVSIWEEKYGGGSYVGSVEPYMSEDGEPIFWINDFGNSHPGQFYGQKRKWSVEETIQKTLKYGASGWCTLDELEQLIAGKGPLLERAMRECGFRPHKRIPNQWVRINKSREEKEQQKSQDEWQKKYKEEERKRWPAVSRGKLGEKLKQLWVLQNEWVGLNETYSIKVNKKGLIYVRLEINPFSAVRTEDLDWFDGLRKNRGHIAEQQNGFCIKARNITLGKEKGVYIKAIRPDNSYVECVWPHQTPQPKIYDLADDLVSRVHGISTPG